jgi:pimeloyl-ACP methyl ester carboxylesterase
LSLFSTISAAATRPALRASHLAEERHEVQGGWSMRIWNRPGDDPWLLLHGLGATAATWLPLLRHGLQGAALLVPELSALGGTRGPRPALGVRDAVVALGELLERRWTGRRVTVAGVSLGGWIAVRLALARPDLVGRLLLVVPGGYRDQDWERIGRTVRIGKYTDSKAIWSALFHRPPWYLRWGRPFLYLAYRSEAVAGALATMDEADAFDDDELGRLAVPVGLIWGESDLLFRVEDGKRMAAAIAGARFRSIAQAGHGVQWERPDQFVAAVADFRRGTAIAPLR